MTEDEEFRKLLVRWFQFGTFCPVMRIHGCRQPVEQIVDASGEVREGTGADNEIWSYGKEAYPILVNHIRIRERMRDYTRSLMKEAHETGAPVIRAMFYEFPEDASCYDITDAYMFGSDVLVAPICHENACSRTVYLPEGAKWLHAGTGMWYEGGRTIVVDAPLERMPLFLREGRQAYLDEMLR